MNRKSSLIIGICFVLMLAINKLANTVYPPHQLPPGATNTLATAASTTAAAVAATAQTNVTVVATPAPQLAVPTNSTEVLVVVTNEYARYNTSTSVEFVEI